MKGALVVAAREVADKKLALLGALLAGFLPLAAPFLPGLSDSQARDSRFATALFVSLTIAFAYPVCLGATVLVSDVVQKRIAFYFSRSLSAFSIWAGKLLGALVLSACGAFLGALPTLLVDGTSALAALGLSGPATAYFFLTTILLLVGAHTVSSMLRLRSTWVVLDFFLAALFGAAIALSLRTLLLTGFWNLSEMKHSPEWLAWWLTAPLIATLLIASYVQVADGRTDARRSHGALSTSLWSLTGLFALPLAGLAGWVSAATPMDLAAVAGGVNAASHGTWVSVSGPIRARGSASASFLYDTESGRFLKRAVAWDPNTVFSSDGKRALSTKWIPGLFEWKTTGLLQTAILDGNKPTAIVSDVEVSLWAQLAVSPSGRRFAVLQGDTLAAYDVSDPAHPRQLLAQRFETAKRFAFVGEEILRRFPSVGDASRQKEIAPAALEIEEISLLSKKSTVTGRVEREDAHLRMSADGRYLVGRLPSRLTLRDGRTGALLATLSQDLVAPQMCFLSGGRIVVAGLAEAAARLLYFEDEKATARSIDLGPAARVILGGEIAPGRVVVALNPLRGRDAAIRSSWKLSIVDVSSGRIAFSADGLVPANLSWWYAPLLSPGEAGLPASKLFLDSSSRLVRLDPATGERKVLLGGTR